MRLIHIHHCRGATWRTISKFIQFDPTLKAIFELHIDDFREIFQMSLNQATNFVHDLKKLSIEKILQEMKKQKIVPITYFDESYPPLLKEIFDPPWVLYCKGNIHLLLEDNLLAIVGTRNPTPYSKQCLLKLIPPLIKENFTIVSGLALGVDSLAHKLTIMANGKTIGVLGSGFYHMYPSKNKKLFEYMFQKHCIITEYPAHVRPQKWHFPERNRIISGLSKGVLLIEAKEKSGSLITADQALEQGREVFAIPGSILNEFSLGTNKLIQSGAKLVIDVEDILVEWN